MRGGCSDIENYAAIYFAGPEAIEDIVDPLQRLVLDGCLYLALGGKGERFFEVQTGSDDRAAERVAVEDHVEDGDGELARRQTVEGRRCRRDGSMPTACRKAGRETAVTSTP